MIYRIGPQRRSNLLLEQTPPSTMSPRSRIMLPPARAWKKGAEVTASSPGSVPAGTVLATFIGGGMQPGGVNGREIAIYLRHDAAGMHVLIPGPTGGRWHSKRLSFRLPAGVRAVNDARAYRVVEH